VFGAQVDTAGTGVTSYVPTAGSTVTRASDVLTLPVAGWNLSKGGVLVAAYRALSPVSGNAVMISDGTDNNKVSLTPLLGTDSRWSFQVISGGVTVINSVNSFSPPIFARRKSAGAWSPNHYSKASDGAQEDVGNGSYPLPVSPTTMYIGSRNGSSAFLGGAVESIAFYGGARSDAFVQQVSR
jgi:hypothetical protein